MPDIQFKKNTTLRVVWEDYYQNITKQKLKEIKQNIHDKYGIPKHLIEIEKRYIQTTVNKKASDLVLDAILDASKLNESYLSYLQDNGATKDDIKKFFQLDAVVLSKMPTNLDSYDTRDRQYDFLWVRGENMFSFGKFERKFSEQKGINLIHSDPYNQGGKSSLSRMQSFLLFGNKIIYGHNRCTYKKVFNKFTKGNVAFVEGEIMVNDEVYYLKRVLKRKESGSVTHKFTIYRYDDVNGEMNKALGRKVVDLSKKNAVKSLKEFEKTVGTYTDYVFAAYYEYHNIEKWIQTTKKQRYRLFCEYLGLALLEEKCQIANKIRNEFLKKSLVSKYKLEDVLAEIKELEASQEKVNVALGLTKKSSDTLQSKLTKIALQIKAAYEKKHPIDRKLKDFSVTNVQEEIEQLGEEINTITHTIQAAKERLGTYASFYKQPAVKLQYQEQLNNYQNLLKNISIPKGMKMSLGVLRRELEDVVIPKEFEEDLSKIDAKIAKINSEISALNFEKSRLEETYSKTPDTVACGKCGNIEDMAETKAGMLETIEDNLKRQALLTTERATLKLSRAKVKEATTKAVNSLKAEIRLKISGAEMEVEKFRSGKYREISGKIEETNSVITNFAKYKNGTHYLANLESKMSNLYNKTLDKKKAIENYLLNQQKFEENAKIAVEIDQLERSQLTYERELQDLRKGLKTQETELNLLGLQIAQKQELVTSLRRDQGREKILRLYQKVHSEDGLSRHIILSVLPHINASLAQLMNGVCDFELYIEFDDKEIKFTIERSGVKMDLSEGSGLEKTISCLSLHHVNLRMTNLPIPNNLILDEVLGRVHPTNISKLIKILQKLCEIFDTVDIITPNHVNSLRSLVDHDIKVVKENEISRIV